MWKHIVQAVALYVIQFVKSSHGSSPCFDASCDASAPASFSNHEPYISCNCGIIGQLERVHRHGILC